MQFPVNLEMWQLVVGALLPAIVSFFKNQAWPDWIKLVLLFGLAVAVSVIEIFVAGEFAISDLVGNALKVAFWATVTYAWVWRPTGADQKLAKSVGVGVTKGVAKVGIIFMIATVFIFAGCATQSGWKAYNTANTEFTEIAEQYEAYYQLQDDAAKTCWKEKFDPVFIRGDQALTDWRKVLNAGDDPEAQKNAFGAIKTDIIMILFQLQEN